MPVGGVTDILKTQFYLILPRKSEWIGLGCGSKANCLHVEPGPTREYLLWESF